HLKLGCCACVVATYHLDLIHLFINPEPRRRGMPNEASKDWMSTTSLSRRSLLTAAAVAGAAALAPQGADAQRKYGPNGDIVRYPEPDVLVLDPRFAPYKIGNAPIQRLYTGTLWAEGPAWNGVGRFLVWSDIPNNV